jgi:hypothetical protein
MIYILSNIYLLLIIYYFTIHKAKINKYSKIKKEVSFGEKCFSCHYDFTYEHGIPPFELIICKSCDRHSKIISLRRYLIFNKIKRRSFLLKNKKKILLYLIFSSVSFIILSLIFNKPYFNNIVSLQWFYFILIDYLMIKPVNLK